MCEPLQTDFAILVQSYAENGDLYSYLHKQRVRFSEKRLVSTVMQPCLEALRYLHARNIVHRDIKPENLLLDGNNNILLADFGLSVCTTEENPVTRAGTLDYMAPEVLECPLKRLPTDYKDRTDIAYTAKVDSWSMGVLAFEMLTGRTPYRHRDEIDMLATIKATELAFPPQVSSLARDWVHQALVLDAKCRASIDELLAHPWITTNCRRRSAAGGPGTPQADGAATSERKSFLHRFGRDFIAPKKVRCHCWCGAGQRAAKSARRCLPGEGLEIGTGGNWIFIRA
jgi:serine/threonine protein kinase